MSEPYQSLSNFFAFTTIILLGLVLFMLFDSSVRINELKREAIKNGYAEYTVNKNGDPEWHWKCDPKERECTSIK